MLNKYTEQDGIHIWKSKVGDLMECTWAYVFLCTHTLYKDMFKSIVLEYSVQDVLERGSSGAKETTA